MQGALTLFASSWLKTSARVVGETHCCWELLLLSSLFTTAAGFFDW